MSKTVKSHFYLGNIKDFPKYYAYLEEREREDRSTPLSGFCESQGEKIVDHDFMEYGFRKEHSTLEEFFSMYSYSQHWAKSLTKIAIERQLSDSNTILFIATSEIKEPKSVQADGFELNYVGEFEYPI